MGKSILKMILKKVCEIGQKRLRLYNALKRTVVPYICPKCVGKEHLTLTSICRKTGV